MKIHSWHFITSSIVLFLLDFLILANKTIFPSQDLGGVQKVIAIICALVFIVGIVWAIFEPFSKTTTQSEARGSRLALTTLEIVFNRLFAFLLVLSTLPLFLNILTLPTIIIFAIFASFIWFGKKYHPITNIIFLIVALGVYFVPITLIDWGIFRVLKEFRIGGFNFNQFSLLFCIAPLIFISFSIRNVLGNILTYFKIGARRNIYFFISLVIALIAPWIYPLLSR